MRQGEEVATKQNRALKIKLWILKFRKPKGLMGLELHQVGVKEANPLE
jgi:hypothetical protein